MPTDVLSDDYYLSDCFSGMTMSVVDELGDVI